MKSTLKWIICSLLIILLFGASCSAEFYTVQLPNNIADVGDMRFFLDTSGNVHGFYPGNQPLLVESEVKSITEPYPIIAFKQDGSLKSISDGLRYDFDNTWQDIVFADASSDHAVAMRADGTFVTAGQYHDGQCDVEEWTDIVDIRVSKGFTVGLKSDGTVVATGVNKHGECNVSNWSDITSISTGYSGGQYDLEGWVVGLKADGTVCSTGSNDDGQCNVQDWDNVIYIKALRETTKYITLGISFDGELLSTDKYFHKDYSIPKDYRLTDVKDIIVSPNRYVMIKHNDNTITLFGKDDEINWCKERLSQMSEAATKDVSSSNANNPTENNDITDAILDQSSIVKTIPLQKGSKGDEVIKLQNRLNELGYSVGRADGDFGNKTKTAIEQFQKDNGLEVTGIADAKTQELLFSDKVIKGTVSSADSNTSSNSDQVKAIASGIDYIKDFALETAPPVFSAFGSTDACKVTEVYCKDKGNDVYQFTAKVKSGSSTIGFGEDLKITNNNGKWKIEEVSSLQMYMDGGLNNITGELVWSSGDSGYDTLLDAFKAVDVNGDGHITKDEIFN